MNSTVKKATLYALIASIIGGILCILNLFIDGYFYTIKDLLYFIMDLLYWGSFIVFFFTLNKLQK